MTGSGLTDMRRRALDRLLMDYLELDHHRREGYLESCRRRWPRLSRWLEVLVEGSHTISLVEQPGTLVGEAFEPSAQAVPELTPGRRLGPWRVSEAVGEGGMATVYRGERADGAFRMTVAIKLLRLQGAGLGEQLRHESNLLARLDHPGITRVLDAGVDTEGGPFVVMEWVEGHDLGQWREIDPSAEQCLDIFIRLCDALAHAHERNVAHGDIKPGNIRLRDDGQVKLMDFGIARLAGGEETGQHLAALTPSFAAPEQLDGQVHTVSSDVYSLGLLLIWLLTGRIPDRSEAGISGISLPSGLAGRRELHAIIRCACAREPQQRYATAAGLAADLRRLREHRPVMALAHTPAYRMGKFARRNPGLVGGMAATFATLTAGLIATSVFFLQAEQAREAAVEERDLAETRAEQLEEVVRFQSEQFSRLDTRALGADLRRAVLGRTQSAMNDHDPEVLEQARTLLGSLDFTGLALEALDEHIFDPALRAIDEQFGTQPLVRARLLEATGTVLYDLGRLERAEDVFGQALELTRASLGDQHVDTWKLMHSMGVVYSRQARYDKGKKFLTDAYHRRRDSLDEGHPDRLESHHALGLYYIRTDDLERARHHLEQALDGRRAVLGEEHPDTLDSQYIFGRLLQEEGKLDAAESVYREALEKHRAIFGERHRDTVKVHSNLGYLFNTLAQYDRARHHYEQVLEHGRETYGEEHPSTLRSYNNLGFALQRLGELEQAQAHFRKALEGRMRLLGERHPDTLVSVSTMGDVLIARGRLEQAEPYLREGLAGSREVLGQHHWRTLASKHNLAQLMMKLGRLEEAERLGREVLDITAEFLDEDHWHAAVFDHGYARILKRLERYRDAESRALQAYRVFEKALGEEHERTLEAAETLVGIYQQLEASTDAEQFAGELDEWKARL